MNGQFYKNTGYQEPLNLATAPIGNVDNEQSYIENILRQNKGKKAKAYFLLQIQTRGVIKCLRE